MKRITVLALLLGFASVAITVSDAWAMYNPEIGRFVQRDPERTGHAGALTSPSYGGENMLCDIKGPLRAPMGDRQVASVSPTLRDMTLSDCPAHWEPSKQNFYEALNSSPLAHLDPCGLWWFSDHEVLTDMGMAAFKFGPKTLAAIKLNNKGMDFPFFDPGPVGHYIADTPTWLGRSQCFGRSTEFVFRTVGEALKLAEDCRKARWDFNSGRAGIVHFSNALHTVQDFSPHHCMTMEEHKQARADDKNLHPGAWLTSIGLTRGYFSAYRFMLRARLWSSEEIYCCVEMPYDLSK